MCFFQRKLLLTAYYVLYLCMVEVLSEVRAAIDFTPTKLTELKIVMTHENGYMLVLLGLSFMVWAPRIQVFIHISRN